jgi:hypothetical protein
MFGYPFIHPPPKQSERPIDLPRPETLGFEPTHMSCVPCGDRIDLGDPALAEWVVRHIDHIREFLGKQRITAKPTWRSSR